MRNLNNAAKKIWSWLKGLNVSMTGKLKLGFIEITVAPKKLPQVQI